MSISRATIKTHLSIALVTFGTNGMTAAAFHSQFVPSAKPTTVPAMAQTIQKNRTPIFREVPKQSTVHPASPSPRAPGSPRTIFENVTLGSQFQPDPTVVRGISGGDRLATDLTQQKDTATGPCVGYVDEQPDHIMELTQFFDYLSLQVQSPQDTTLVVRGPGGTWCNDDYNDMNPGIAGQWLSGTYQIWVGSYASNQYSPYIIQITETR